MHNLFRIYLLFQIFLTINIVAACVKHDDDPSSSYPIADGTFIQDYLIYKWDDARWQKELGFLKEAGMHYIVFAPTMLTGKDEASYLFYPGNLAGTRVKYADDLVENCLRNAQKAGFKVFLGLNFNEKWWQRDQWNAEWLFGQMELGNQLADDLVRRYKSRYKETMYGWYWVWEIDNLNHQTDERQDILVEALNINIDHLNEITPGMPFMFCPFVNYRVGNTQANRDMWQYVFAGTHFRKGDIFAPQDCVGAGGLELGMVDKWFSDMNEAVKSKPGLLFWSDTETFDQRFWTSAPIDRFVKQMETVKPYVSNIITFAYSFYYSPTRITNGFHETYLEYVKTGTLPMNTPPEPVENLIVYANSEGKINLSWKEPENKNNLAGYYIFRNNQLIGNLQYKSTEENIRGFKDENAGSKEKYLYEVCSYACSGTTSIKRSVNYE